MRVLVCGGRDYSDYLSVRIALNSIDAVKPIEFIIEGGASGADALARRWAKAHGVDVLTFEADWKVHGKAAGPMRNQEMLEKARPQLVVAFPGGKGTDDMLRRAKAAGVKVTRAGFAGSSDRRALDDAAT